MLRIFVGYSTFLMLQNNHLAKEIFEFHARVQKYHFGRMEKLPKRHFSPILPIFKARGKVIFQIHGMPNIISSWINICWNVIMKIL